MPIQTVNPSTNELLRSFEEMTDDAVESDFFSPVAKNQL